MARQMAEHVGLADESDLPPELLLWTGNMTRTPPPSRCGSALHIMCRIMRLWAFPNIKFVFLKGLSLNSSSYWT
jgi:hypothetical protein